MKSRTTKSRSIFVGALIGVCAGKKWCEFVGLSVVSISNEEELKSAFMVGTCQCELPQVVQTLFPLYRFTDLLHDWESHSDQGSGNRNDHRIFDPRECFTKRIRFQFDSLSTGHDGTTPNRGTGMRSGETDKTARSAFVWCLPGGCRSAVEKSKK